MGLVLYNTFSKREEEFAPLKPPAVTMYTCGPTVYSRPHIGNYSSFLMADLLRRWLEVGHKYQVKHVKNITDVGHLLHDADHGDDKIQKEAEKEKVHPLTIAERYTEQYLEDEKALKILEPDHRPKASETIPEMITMIQVLLEKGNAYELPDAIYFSVLSFPQYGGLSGNSVQSLSAGARVEVREGKKHPADFALWKKCIGENARHVLRWKFPSGEMVKSEGEDPDAGFPGWHIECSAMSRKFLGDQLDLHTGGEDNIFPHHESEIAQSECVTGKQFVRFWLHKRRIDLKGAKMSKSLGNVLQLPDIIGKGYSPQDVRYYLLSVHYRTNLKFSWKGLDAAKTARRSIAEWMEEREGTEGADGTEGTDGVQKYIRDFSEAMDADLNTPAALAAVFDCMTASRKQSLKGLPSFIMMIRSTFGCFEHEEQGIRADVQLLLDQRQAAREKKDFKESDRLRDEIRARGFDVRDTEEGQKARKM